ncbi:DUF5074 domain-containing protein [Flavobacterium selenitireducens]|uniref:DUF5074 domain-containing protein n=1 Tax=Flavobacterium selenitireducens TaxID=2722704 RepID=UPI00168AF2D4|nr:T9SS type A sorting domain-containing protein [Flavobacterium selenitireducens]MBD3582895.1 T9SS type A sorting domain-containing protein [Flavobacterium selenitireducens]
MNNNYFFKGVLILSALIFQNFTAISQTFENGVFVLNEGGAGSTNASVSFIPDGAAVVNDIYSTINPNQGPLGDTAQSMTFAGNNAYIILNISNTIKIVNRYTFEYVATVSTGLENPRYMAVVGNKAYVTNWGSGGDPDDDYIAVLNVETNAIEATIELAEGVERIFNINDMLYVLHQGGYSFGKTVSVVNPVTQTLVNTIEVGDVPNSAYVEQGFLYVLCGGKPSWSGSATPGGMYRIDLSNNQVVESHIMTGMSPANLQSSGNGMIYFTSDFDVYSASLSTLGANPQLLFSTGDQGVYGIYGMNLINDKLYVGDAAGYIAPGSVLVYDLSGNVLGTHAVGWLPNSFYKAEPQMAVPDTQISAIGLYPNPATRHFYLSNVSDAKVCLYDFAGRLIKFQDYTASGISVSDLPRGLYVVQIASDNQLSTQKLIVK